MCTPWLFSLKCHSLDAMKPLLCSRKRLGGWLGGTEEVPGDQTPVQAGKHPRAVLVLHPTCARDQQRPKEQGQLWAVMGLWTGSRRAELCPLLPELCSGDTPDALTLPCVLVIYSLCLSRVRSFHFF